MRNRQTVHAEEFPIIYVDNPAPPKNVEHNSPLLSQGNFHPKRTVWKGAEGVPFQQRSLTSPTSAR